MKTRVFVYEYISGGSAGADAMPELLAQGKAMRDAMIGDLSRIDNVMVTAVALPGEPQDNRDGAGNVAYCQPRPHESAVAMVRRQAARHDVCWVVAPESGNILLGLQQIVGNARWLGCDAAAIACAGSKSATAGCLGRHGIATPRAWRAGEAPDAACRRWVVKPDDGAGAVGTYRYAHFRDAHAAWRRRMAEGEAVVLEGWVDGDPLSVSLLCGPAGAEVLSINRQHIRVDAAGQVHYEGVQTGAVDLRSPHGAELAALAERVAAATPGLSGFVGIDVVWHPLCGPVVIEVNPRVTCAYIGLSAMLGRNLACEMLAGHQIRAELRETDGASYGN